MDISIIIVNWNTEKILRDCLESVYVGTKQINFEVIVVDNGSTDGSVKMVEENFKDIMLIKNKRNVGFAAANNQGMAIAKGRYVLLLNSDTIVLNNAIAKTVKFADTHPEAAVVACRVLNPDRTVQKTCFMFPSLLNMLLSSTYLYKLFPWNKFFGRERMTWWDRDDIREIDVATGCFMLVRREAIKHVGIMDERFFMYGEETDWCYRFKKAGWKVLFTSVSEIIHLGGQSASKNPTAMNVQVRLSILKFIHKHYGSLRYSIACFLVVLFFLVRIPVWFIIWLLITKRRDVSALKLRAYTSGVGKILLSQVCSYS